MAYRWASSEVAGALGKNEMTMKELAKFKKHPQVIEGPPWSQFASSPRDMFSLGVKVGKSSRMFTVVHARSRFYMLQVRNDNEALSIIESCKTPNLFRWLVKRTRFGVCEFNVKGPEYFLGITGAK